MITNLTRTATRTVNLSQSKSGVLHRTIVSIKDVKYTASATASGAGRNGKTELDDGSQSFKLAMPTELGGKGDGANPEQFFAMGYSACFLTALQAVARKEKKRLPDGVFVKAAVSIGEAEAKPGFALEVTIEVQNVDDQALVDEAHALCPYSRAVTEGIKVTINST